MAFINKNRSKVVYEIKKFNKKNLPMKEKVSFGTNLSSKTVNELRIRERRENSQLIKEANDEQNQLRKKRLYTCHCGNTKSIRFRECFECNKKRKEQALEE